MVLLQLPTRLLHPAHLVYRPPERPPGTSTPSTRPIPCLAAHASGWKICRGGTPPPTRTSCPSRLQQLAKIGADAAGGVTRAGFTSADLAGREQAK
ncbi:hypothetical protein ACFSTC_38160 [Nonomuraea ferruginea]